MSAAFAEDARFAQRFRREAMAAAQIKSPQIAQVFDHGVTATSEGAPPSTIARGGSAGSLAPARPPAVPARVALPKGSGGKPPAPPAPSKDTIGLILG